MKFSAVIVLIGATCAIGSALHAELADGIKAVVHDSIVTSQEVEILTAPLVDELRRQYRGQPEAYERELAKTLEENLEQLLQRQLILHEFSTAGYSIPESVIEEQMQKRVRSLFGGDRTRMIKTLQAEGLTYEKYRQQVLEQMTIIALREKNVSGEIIISPHKIENYYLAHKDNFKVEDEVKLRMIVLNIASPPDAPQVRKLAEEIIGKIKEGAAFAEMAEVYSQGRNPGGDWGWADRAKLRKELADTAFSLKPGEVSGIIETSDACFLMLVEQKRPAHVKALSEVREEIEKNMLTEERDRLQKLWIERLKKKTFVRYF